MVRHQVMGSKPLNEFGVIRRRDGIGAHLTYVIPDDMHMPTGTATISSRRRKAVLRHQQRHPVNIVCMQGQ